ncbi:xanthorhodopsin [Sphingomonas sp. AAP5]|jgi:bacteriorhodopsin|uniref:bacteriorhodopsin-like n=1 Tax=unclassified Sphingomonas TaxID=196159 RepID=UPI001057563F|nr:MULTISPECIES: bacteriorhodopsin-like [unclassified Sphingomonas]MDY7526137.1 bacteriorhodopsin-like [Sphingomonas sp. 10B4]MEB0280941.1 bacteriorhodopsin-like [Sphingomonas sp. 10B4]QBM75193.1 xanthorhodopsin [Sphingomonas sp. AAP5]
MDIVTPFQFSLVYNAFSFTFAAMGAATAFLWLSRGQVAPAYRTALTISGLVTGIAAYHYFRIFESWNEAYTFKDGIVTATGYAFNDAYRYVDWLLTVPLLLIELVLVMRLSREETSSKAIRLGSAAALMIILGYPGEIASDIPTRAIWGTLSAIPFVYIVWELFSGLGASIKQQPASAQGLVRKARLLTFASWGFYPIVYMAPYAGLTGGNVTTTIQIGYTIADIVAKAGLGILIFLIAVRKSEAEADGHKGYAA